MGILVMLTKRTSTFMLLFALQTLETGTWGYLSEEHGFCKSHQNEGSGVGGPNSQKRTLPLTAAL